MAVLAVPAAGMWTGAPPVTTAGAWTTCCWWARSRGFPDTPPPAPPPPPLPSRSSPSLVWSRERRLNVRRRKLIIFLIHRAGKSSGLCPLRVFHTAVSLFLLRPPPPPSPPRPPWGEESLSRHGGDFRAAAQSSGWMSAAAAAAERGLRPHTNSTLRRPLLRIRQPVDLRPASRLCLCQDSVTETPRSLLPLSCPSAVHLPPLRSLLRTDSKIPEKSLQTSPQQREWVRRLGKGQLSPVHTEPENPRWWFPVRSVEPKLVLLTGKSQPAKLDKQHGLRLRTNTEAEQTSVLADWPKKDQGKQWHLSTAEGTTEMK